MLADAPPVPEVGLALETVLGLPDALREHQPGFDRTGGLHAAGLATSEGRLVVVREDVGRHNAVDKAVGSRILAGRAGAPGAGAQRAYRLRAGAEGGALRRGRGRRRGAPTSLARTLAERAGLVLVGFTRPGRCVVYAGADRVVA